MITGQRECRPPDNCGRLDGRLWERGPPKRHLPPPLPPSEKHLPSHRAPGFNNSPPGPWRSQSDSQTRATGVGVERRFTHCCNERRPLWDITSHKLHSESSVVKALQAGTSEAVRERYATNHATLQRLFDYAGTTSKCTFNCRGRRSPHTTGAIRDGASSVIHSLRTTERFCRSGSLGRCNLTR